MYCCATSPSPYEPVQVIGDEPAPLHFSMQLFARSCMVVPASLAANYGSGTSLAFLRCSRMPFAMRLPSWRCVATLSLLAVAKQMVDQFTLLRSSVQLLARQPLRLRLWQSFNTVALLATTQWVDINVPRFNGPAAIWQLSDEAACTAATHMWDIRVPLCCGPCGHDFGSSAVQWLSQQLPPQLSGAVASAATTLWKSNSCRLTLALVAQGV